MDADNRREPPIVERTAARLVVIDAADRILLLHVQDLSNPQAGTAWELPGGGMEADETFVDAETRELREETGLEVRPEWIEAPRWRRQIEYVYRGVCHLYPRSLPTLLPRFLAGESLEEPLEIWSPDG